VSLETPLSPAPPESPRPQRRSSTSISTTGMLVKILVLGIVLAIAVWGAFPLVSAHNWTGLAILVVVTALLFWIYSGKRKLPAKYLIVGTLFLVAFQVVPVIMTATTAFTNYGDGHLGDKATAIAAIESNSLKEVPGSSKYQLSAATDGSGALVLLLTDANGKYYVGTDKGLTELPAADVTAGLTGKITKATGYTVLNLGQANARANDISAISVPTAQGAIRSQGLTSAFELRPTQLYDSGCDCVTDSTNGTVYKADASTGQFVGPNDQKLAQGWKVGVGFKNFGDVVSNPVIRGPFLKIIVWNFAFAILVVVLTFALGLGMAMVMNNPRMKGQRIYRSLLILPYAMPVIAMLLVWRDMFNTDFGLINRLLGIHIDWFGTTWGARAAVLIAQLWVGYPYMFLVCTGALQSVPADLVEAAAVDGAKPFKAFRTITFPLLLVATAPLLIGSFAFNFNNFGAIFLTSEGGPFPPDNPTAGGTDLLISYTYRLAFGTGGHEYGFAAAISIYIFAIVAIVSYLGFRRTKVLEEIN
jgi:arabinogalactan oligomer / maltooligosaccharide transport system permease protein